MPVTIQRLVNGADFPMIRPIDGGPRPRQQTAGETTEAETENNPVPFSTSVEEARMIVALCARRLSPPCLLSLAMELDVVVGSKTNNAALQAALKILLAGAADLATQGNASRNRGWFPAFCAIVALHFGLLVAVAASFLVLPFRAPGYIALPLCVLIFNLLFTPVECPLTRLENLCRRKMGWPEIRGFVKHYIVQPLREHRKRCRPQSEPTTS